MKRLESFLKVLDVKMQEEGLFPEEVEAQQAARGAVTCIRIYEEKMGVAILDSLVDPGDPLIKVLRDRLHLIEGDEAAIKMILEYLGYIRKEVVPHLLALEAEVAFLKERQASDRDEARAERQEAREERQERRDEGNIERGVGKLRQRQSGNGDN